MVGLFGGPIIFPGTDDRLCYHPSYAAIARYDCHRSQAYLSCARTGTTLIHSADGKQMNKKRYDASEKTSLRHGMVVSMYCMCILRAGM